MPFSSINWYKTWLKIHEDQYQPYLLANDVSIAPFVRSGNSIKFIDKYTDHVDIIGSPTSWLEVLEFARQDGVKEINLGRVPSYSPTLGFFNNFAVSNTLNASCTILSQESAPKIELPATFEEYISSIREKRKKYNRFKREHPDVLIEVSSNPEDDVLAEKLKQALKELAIPKNSLIFASLACGQHIDHILVRNACAAVFQHVIYYLDFPYSQTYPNEDIFIEEHNLTQQVRKLQNKDLKMKAVLAYKSQMVELFKTVPIVLPDEESFYLPSNVGVSIVS